MTLRRWVDTTDEYNCQLVQKLGTAAVRKNPLALLCKLGEMEARLIERVQRDDFKCKYHLFTVTTLVHMMLIHTTYLQPSKTLKHSGDTIALSSTLSRPILQLAKR